MVGANVRAELARANRTQTWLGAALGVSQGQVSARLAGRISLTVHELVRIGSLLDVPLSTLLAGVELEAAS